MFHRASRLVLLLLSLLPLSTAFAQNDKPVPINVFNPPAWPTLSLNSNQQPSCAFWTPAGKAPEYFCAAGIANIGYDVDTSLCTPLGCAGFALRAVHVDPQTGNVSAGPPTIKAQSVALPVNPDVLACTPLQDQFGTNKISCLLRNDPGPAQASFIHSVIWDGNSWGNPTVILNGFSFNFVSNFSCVPWVGSTAHPKNVTCFALATFENDGPANSVRILHWTWDGMTWNPPATATGTQFEVSPIAGISASRLSCNSPAPDQFACFVHSPAGGAFVNELTADGSNWTQLNGLAWSSTPHQFGQLIAGLSTPPTCLAAQSASNAPARNDCFIGDNGVPVDPPINWGWLYWVPDDNSRNFAVAMTERFQISDPPSCVQWAASQIECFVPDKPLDPLENRGSVLPNATVWHILSYGMDWLTLEAEMLHPPSDRSVGFWQESLGMPAPTNKQLEHKVGLGHTFNAFIDNPKTLTSFNCVSGPKFQSLCVAGLVDSNFLGLSTVANPDLDAFRTSRRLVFKLVGNPNGVQPQAPTTVVVKDPPPTKVNRPQ